MQKSQILPFLVTAAIRMPRLTIALALLGLAVLAGTISYTGFLVIGVLAEYLGIGRFTAALLLGVLFARIPWIRGGKLRTVGLIPQLVRRPLILGLLALCLLHFASRGEFVSAALTAVVAAFLLVFPSLRRAMFDCIVSSALKFAGRQPPKRTDDTVIEGEFREKKD